MEAQPDRILRIAKVLDMTGLSRSTLYRRINDGSFPKQVQISAYCIGWRESSVAALLADPMGWKGD